MNFDLSVFFYLRKFSFDKTMHKFINTIKFEEFKVITWILTRVHHFVRGRCSSDQVQLSESPKQLSDDLHTLVIEEECEDRDCSFYFTDQ